MGRGIGAGTKFFIKAHGTKSNCICWQALHFDVGFGLEADCGY